MTHTVRSTQMRYVLRITGLALLVLMLFLLTGLFFPTAWAQGSTTVTVNTTSVVVDGNTNSVSALLANPGADGVISFPEALTAVNKTGAGYTINFNLPHGATIALTSTLSLSVSNTTIDGDVDGNGTPDVMLDAPTGFGFALLNILSNNNTIRHLAIPGLDLVGAGAYGNQVVGSYIGTDIEGKVAHPREVNGMELYNGAHDNIIEGNVIAGNVSANPNWNASGIFFHTAHDNIVRGNRIGVSVDGNPLPNEIGVAISVGSQKNTIGGLRASAACESPCNVISGNNYFGITVGGTGTISNVVQGNYIGVNPEGTAVMPNGQPSIWKVAGVAVTASRNTIGGMRASSACDGPCNVISGNRGHGVEIFFAGAADNEVKGNYIGLDPTGTVTMPNAYSGVALFDTASRNIIGGKRSSAACDGPCNVISGNRENGVVISSTGTISNVVQGNYIGLNVTGTITVPNQLDGVIVANGASQNIIGGEERAFPACLGPCNVISGNSKSGVVLTATGTISNVVQGNYVGVDLFGVVALPNTLSGVEVANGARQNTIGGYHVGAFCGGPCNVIGGNKEHGVHIWGPDTTGNLVQGNHIGRNALDTARISNERSGIFVAEGASNILIGGPRIPGDCDGICNVISGNLGHGVVITGTSTRDITVRGNKIYDNGGLGINLGGSKDRPANNDVTPNDPDDSDSGPNDLMNFPVGVTTVIDTNTNTTSIWGMLPITNPTSAVLDFYAIEAVDVSGFGEGQRYLGSKTANSSGIFTLTVSGVFPFVSVTATGNGGTSEFSPVCGDPDGNGNPDNDGDSLCDDWETKGIDFDGDGNPDLPLHTPPFDAKPNRKDIFVEIDYMDCSLPGSVGCTSGHNHRPDDSALQSVINAFAHAPVDGGSGISLHLVGANGLVDEAIPEITPVRFDSGPVMTGVVPAGHFNDLKLGNPVNPCGIQLTHGHFGTRSDRLSLNCPNIIGARRLVFRYAIFGHNHAHTIGSSGRSEIIGNDFLVSLGAPDWTTTTQLLATVFGGLGTTPANEWHGVQAGTFMHELGHTLGLKHGGADGINCKPNYLSVMNYSFQWDIPGFASTSLNNQSNCVWVNVNVPGVGLVPRLYCRTSRPLDYARSLLGLLNENNSLNENSGMGGPIGHRTLFGGIGGSPLVGPASGPIDWNDNQAIDLPLVSADVNWINVVPLCISSPGQLSLTGHDDWSSLVYNFRISGYFADGAGQSVPDIDPEMTDREFLDLGLGSPDFDSDGFSNADDNCPLVFNLDQADGDGDGIGDACSVQTLTLNPSSVTAGMLASGAITLTLPVSLNDAIIFLESSDTAVVTVPVSITIPAGASAATFSITTYPVTASTRVTITAAYGIAEKTATLTVEPAMTFVYLPLVLRNAITSPPNPNGGYWDSRFGGQPGENGPNGKVCALAVSGSDVYVGGGFDTVGGVPANNVARWNGESNTWSALGSGVSGVGAPCIVYSIAISGSDVYVGGRFPSAGGVAGTAGIARWDGANWSALGGGIYGINGESRVFKVTVADGVVYVGGEFFYVNKIVNPIDPSGVLTVKNIAGWNGSWFALGYGEDVGVAGSVQDIETSGGHVYVGGDIYRAGGVPASNIAVWNGTSWSALGSGVSGGFGGVSALAVRGDDVYATGLFFLAGGVPAKYVARWNGTSWSALGSGLNGICPIFERHLDGDLMVVGSEVYVGGCFTMAGGVSASNIAKWNSLTSTWSELGSGVWGGSVSDIALGADGVYLGGSFIEAGGKPSNYFALWHTTFPPAGSSAGRVIDAGQERSRAIDMAEKSGQVRLILLENQVRQLQP